MHGDQLKKSALAKGAVLCNIAPVTRFKDAPKGFHPNDIMPSCKSVVVFAIPFPTSVLESKSMAPYTFVRNMMVRKIDQITFELCNELEAHKINAIPIPCDEPYESWDEKQRQGRAILSLKHAAVLAGLGVMGKNTLLVTKQFGNMVWLGGILVSEPFDADAETPYRICLPECSLCLDFCPVQALDGTTINQKLCRGESIASTEGGGMVYSCNTCRTVCPNCQGFDA